MADDNNLIGFPTGKTSKRKRKRAPSEKIELCGDTYLCFQLKRGYLAQLAGIEVAGISIQATGLTKDEAVFRCRVEQALCMTRDRRENEVQKIELHPSTDGILNTLEKQFGIDRTELIDVLAWTYLADMAHHHPATSTAS